MLLDSDGQTDAALATYTRVLELKPDHADASWRKGLLLADAGNYSEAMPLLERYAAVHKDDQTVKDVIESVRKAMNPGDGAAETGAGASTTGKPAATPATTTP